MNYLGPQLNYVGSPLNYLGHLLNYLGPFSNYLGASLELLGASLELRGAYLELLGGSLEAAGRRCCGCCCCLPPQVFRHRHARSGGKDSWQGRNVSCTASSRKTGVHSQSLKSVVSGKGADSAQLRDLREGPEDLVVEGLSEPLSRTAVDLRCFLTGCDRHRRPYVRH